MNTWDKVSDKAGETGSARGLKRGWMNSWTIGPQTGIGTVDRNLTSPEQLGVWCCRKGQATSCP